MEVWDWDRFTKDDLIGTCHIDLEDRWFDQKWHSYGKELVRFAPLSVCACVCLCVCVLVFVCVDVFVWVCAGDRRSFPAHPHREQADMVPQIREPAGQRLSLRSV